MGLNLHKRKKEIKWCKFVSFGAFHVSRKVRAGMGKGYKKEEETLRGSIMPILSINLFVNMFVASKWHPLLNQDKTCKSGKTCYCQPKWGLHLRRAHQVYQLK